MMCNYLQTKDKNLMLDFIKEIPDDHVVEITVHGKEKKRKTSGAHIYINDEPVYDLDFINERYMNLKLDTEFYLTPAEGFALSMYLCCGIFETIPPHWWAYAERNIARHHDPLKYLREAKENNQKIVVTLDD